MKLRRNRKGPITMPIVSMGDIAFLMIIFFMVCSNFVKESQIEYKSPTSLNLASVESSSPSVAMDKEGKIYLEGKPVASADALKADLEKRLKEKDPKDVKGRSVLFKCDLRLARDDFQPVMEAIVGAGGIVVAVGDLLKPSDN
ncbi:MAG: biopolymer transporter ExbD [Lentisphaerae bacterium]|nr:biopolymer transporter ExbD [Lentisphaerota bacterium]